MAITGATGFIGRHIAVNLLARGFSLRALTRLASRQSMKNLHWVEGDLQQPESLAELVSGADCVVHCAGQVRGHNEAVFTHCNVGGSLNLLQAAKESGRCQRLAGCYAAYCRARARLTPDCRFFTSVIWLKRLANGSAPQTPYLNPMNSVTG